MKIAENALERLSITHIADRPYTEISGGERQLTLIARALAQGARIFIMNEPAAGLDYGNQLKLLDQIVKLSREGYTFIKATHSPEHALWIANRAVMIKNGTVMADGACAEIINTENLLRLSNCVKDGARRCRPFPYSVDGTAGEVYPLDGLIIRADYTYEEAKNRSEGRVSDDLTFIPKHKVDVGIQYFVPVVQTRLDFNMTYVGETYSRLPTPSSVNNPVLKADDYTVFDAKITRPIWTYFEAYAACKNIFDKNYESEVGYPAVGRVFWVGIVARY